MRATKPLVWLPACHRHLDLSDPGSYSVLADRYASAVTAVGLQPVSFPMAQADDVPALLSLVDGVLLTGSPSNVDASRFGGQALATDLLDPRRDALTMALVPAAIASGTPLFGVCRGMQEMNVALGGSLHQRVDEVPGLMNHREPDDEDPAVQFALAHQVRLAPGSVFARWADGATARVNSLHGQGVRRLAPGLSAEAHAPDGLIEGVRATGAQTFAIGVQWHPEWHHAAYPFYERSFQDFAQACTQHRLGRGRN